MIERNSHYIGGAWAAPASPQAIEVTDASTGRPWARVPAGTRQDVDAAVGAARAAFEGWSQTPAAERADALLRVAAQMEARAAQMTDAIVHEVGMPLKMASRLQVAVPQSLWKSYARITREFPWESQVGHSVVVREPIGVVGAITPWNFPLNQIALKVAAALGAGCTVVLKPSEVAPINAYLLADAIHAAGLPAGVFNLVCGFGPEVGEALASHDGVDMVSFTGSTRAGRRVAELAGAGIRKVTLELGGKSAAVVLDDADLAAAVKGTLNNCFLNSGQVCAALTRLVVPRARLAEAVALVRKGAERFTVGPALAEGSVLGPLISGVQRDRVLAHVRQAIADGAELVCGGAEPPAVPAEAADGYYVAPTVFVVQDAGAAVAQEEVFGPVLTLIPHDGDDDAVRIANATRYGLSGAVWSADRDRALRVARRMRTGQVDINGAPWNPQAPFGGYGLSGIGRENGSYGFEEYLQHKAVQLPPAAA